MGLGILALPSSFAVPRPQGGDERGPHRSSSQVCAFALFKCCLRSAQNRVISPAFEECQTMSHFFFRPNRPISVSLLALVQNHPMCHFLEHAIVYTSKRGFSAGFISLLAISDAMVATSAALPLLGASQAPRARSFVPSSWKQRLPFGERGGERRPNLIESKILQTLRSPGLACKECVGFAP